MSGFSEIVDWTLKNVEDLFLNLDFKPTVKQMFDIVNFRFESDGRNSLNEIFDQREKDRFMKFLGLIKLE
jgi:hypothetical protein